MGAARISNLDEDSEVRCHGSSSGKEAEIESGSEVRCARVVGVSAQAYVDFQKDQRT